MPRNLALAQRKGDRADAALVGDRVRLQPDRRVLCDGGLVECIEGEGAAGHVGDDAGLAGLADRTIADDAAVAQDDDAVGDREHLVEAVADEDDGDAMRAEIADDGEQRLGLVRRQRGGRLVEDQQFGVAGERLGDLDDLLLGRRERTGLDPRIDMAGADPDEQLARLGRERLAVDQAGPAGHVIADEQVLHHRQRGDQRQLLVDMDDAGVERRPGIPEDGFLATPTDGAAVARQRARQDVDEGRLAGAVLAQERDDLAGGNVEIDPVQDAVLVEGFRDAAGGEKAVGHGALGSEAVRTPPEPGGRAGCDRHGRRKLRSWRPCRARPARRWRYRPDRSRRSRACCAT